MKKFSPNAMKLVMKASGGGVETSLVELSDLFDITTEKSSIKRTLELETILGELNLEISPSSENGTFESMRLLRLRRSHPITAQLCRGEFSRGESHTLELKASLEYDHAKAEVLARTEHRADPKDLRSEEVLNSALKTICGFLNADGGVLYVGVSDDFKILGLAPDLSLIRLHGSLDHWELRLRDLIKTRFKEGNAINDYLEITFVTIEEKTIARISVTPRTKCSFLKDRSGSYLCYCRQGNRTSVVDITEFEEFLESRKVRNREHPHGEQILH